MIAAWMLRAVAASALVALAALLASEALRLAGRQRRWAWAAGLALAVALPAAGWWWPGALSLARASTAGGDAMSWLLRAAETAGAGPGALAGTGGTALLARMDAPLAWMWAAATAATLAVFAGAQWRLRRARRRWTAAEVAGTPVLLADAVGPAVVGVVSPRVVLPRWALDVPAEERALMVRHERAHLEAGDSRLLAVTAAAVAVMPWNPALWWMHRRLRDAMETDCDARVLARGADPWTYGQTLLRIAARPSARRLLLSPALGSPTLLERRIVAMTDTLPTHRAPRALALAVVAAAVLVAACEAATTEPVSAPSRAGTVDFVATMTAETERENEDGSVTMRLKTPDGAPAGTVIVRPSQAKEPSGPQPLYYVDGRLTSPEEMRAISPERIERVEVTKGAAALAINPQAAGGVISITLKKV